MGRLRNCTGGFSTGYERKAAERVPVDDRPTRNGISKQRSASFGFVSCGRMQSVSRLFPQDGNISETVDEYSTDPSAGWPGSGPRAAPPPFFKRPPSFANVVLAFASLVACHCQQGQSRRPPPLPTSFHPPVLPLLPLRLTLAACPPVSSVGFGVRVQAASEPDVGLSNVQGPVRQDEAPQRTPYVPHPQTSGMCLCARLPVCR